MEFTSTLALMNFLSEIGEQSCLYEKRPGIRDIDTIIAAAALFETLFTNKTIGQRDENTSSILIDTFESDFMYDASLQAFNDRISTLKSSTTYHAKKFEKLSVLSEGQLAQLLDRGNNIVTSLTFMHLIGWKFHEGQQKPKAKGSAQFSLRDVVDELNDKDEQDEHGQKKQVKYGVLIDDGETVHEK